MTQNPKQTLRMHMRAMRTALDEKTRARLDQAVCRQLMKVIAQQNPAVVHTFLPMGSEVNVYPVILELMGHSTTLVVPKVLPDGSMTHLVLESLEQLEAGPFGTRHPASGHIYTGAYDLIIVPGLAFDRQFNRLGYGKGHYDMFLKDHPEAFKLGVAYPFQIVEELPLEAHDICLDGVVY